MLERIKNHGVLGANDPELVAKRLKRLNANQLLVEQMEAMNRSFTPTGPGVAPKAFPRSLERVLGTNDLIGIRFFDQGLKVSRAVARVQIHDQQGRSLGYGTGFLVSPRLFLTNNHVLDSAEAASASQAEFNFQENGAGEMQPSEVFAFTPSDFFLTDKEHDYTLVSIKQDARLVNYGWLPLIPQTGKLVVGETVNIIQHPNGEPKQLAIRDNKVIDELELFLHYETDTSPGSSGSPVFNDQWEVVALHHSGVPRFSAEGKIQSTDGRDWEEWMGEQRIAWIANEGVRVSRLVQHVQAQNLTEPQRQLVAEMLAAKPLELPSSPAEQSPSPPPAMAVTQQVEAAGHGPGLPPAQGSVAT
jgi:V8-like Glu-specific endopeptidase